MEKIIFSVYSCPKGMKFCKFHLGSIYYVFLYAFKKKLPLRVVKDLLWPKICEKGGFGGVKLNFYDSMGHFWGNYLIDLVIYVSLMKLTKYRPFRATINTKNNFCRKILEIFHFQQFSPYLTLKLVSV